MAAPRHVFESAGQLRKGEPLERCKYCGLGRIAVYARRNDYLNPRFFFLYRVQSGQTWSTFYDGCRR